MIMKSSQIYGVIVVMSLSMVTVLLMLYQPSMLTSKLPPFNRLLKTHVDHSRGVLEDKLRNLYDGVQTFVLFIGYARSGHSLVGSILDAHPQIIIPHEFKVIGQWEDYKNTSKGDSGLLKNRLFFDIQALSREQAMFGNRASSCPSGYCYHVSGQWQGTYKDKIKVIGDKKGTSTSSLLRNSKEFEVLEEMQRVLQIPLKFIHVIRNPFDNIATKLLRKLNSRDIARGKSFKVNSSRELDDIITTYFGQVKSVQKLHEYGKFEVLDIYGYKIISHPQESLKKLCSFLQVDNYKDYIDASSKLLYSNLSITRHSVVWTNEQKARVTNEIKKYPFMKPFTFYSN